MGNTLDIAGNRYNKLTAIRYDGHKNSSGKRMWLFKCDCGNEFETVASAVVHGRIKSCGCSHSTACISRRSNLIGQKYGRLTVIADKRTDGVVSQWLCRCDCGKEKIIRQSDILSGKTKSCGCLQREVSKKKVTKHGLSYSRLYTTYNNMLKRCLNPKNIKYSAYGGRGICICDKWLGKEGFISFSKWALSSGYKDNLTIERVDVNGNYEPDNCTWIPAREQAINRRSTHWVEINSIKKPLSHWCKLYGISSETVRQRVRTGWNEITAITTPV